MSQKFISLEDAATKLGVPKERLNEIRESGDLRAYRDGASWKFRTEDIENLDPAALGAGEPDDLAMPGDDLSLDDGLSLSDDLSLEGDPEPSGELKLDASDSADEADELKLEDSSDDIGLGVEPLGDGDDAESILMTGDQEPEGGVPRPQSTIIGKSDALSLDDDLQLASASDVSPPISPASDSMALEDSGELELDLEQASGSILNGPSPSEAAKSASAESIEGASADMELEELELDLSGSGTDLADSLASQDSLTGDSSPSAGSVAGLSGIDSFELSGDEDDDLVLGGDDGSDAVAGDSGIDLSPSDSGFALDEVPLDLGGSAMGSALDLASLSSASQDSDSGADLGMSASLSGVGGDFQLTPGDSGVDEEDSSQIVALEDIGEEDEDLPGFEAVDDDDDQAVGFDEGLAADPVAAPIAATAGVGAKQEIPFPGWVIGLLTFGFFSMLMAGVIVMDLLQSMWSWDEPYAITSSLMDGLLSLIGE